MKRELKPSDKRNIKPSQYSNFVTYHIYVNDFKKLVDYGFIEKSDRYVYYTQRNTNEIVVWKKHRHRTNSQMTFSYAGCLKFTIELCYLFACLLKDNVIRFKVSTTEESKKAKIDELTKQLEILTQEREALINGK